MRFTAKIALPPAGGKAPARVKIWSAGANPGDYGACNFTREGAATVLADYQRRGNAGVLDFEHATNPKANPNYDPARPPPGAGYYDLQLVDTPAGPDMFLDPVRWSDCGRPFPVPGEVCCARHQIESGQRCYLSNDWLMDPITRVPFRLNKVSLVQEPGAYGINLLASAGANRRSTTPMDEVSKIKAAYQGAMALAQSTDESVKAAAEALMTALKTAAGALGIDLEAADDSAATDVIAEATPAPPGAQPAKPGVAAAPLSGIASRGLSAGEVQRIASQTFHAEQAKRDLIQNSMARPGMTPAMASFLASRPLVDVRAFVGALPPLPVVPPAGATTTAKVPATPLHATASASAVEGQPAAKTAAQLEDDGEVEKLRRQLGVSPLHVTAARESASKGELGVLSITRLEEMRKASVAAKTAAK